MKSIILIQAHKDLIQINNLIAILANENVRIYVNLDAKSGINPQKINPIAQIIYPQTKVFWCDFSLVEATLTALRQINSENPVYKHLFFISAQHYPTKNVKTITDFLDVHKNYMTYNAIDKNGWDVPYRFQLYHFMKYKITRIFSHSINLPLKIFNIKRKLPNNLKGFGGSSWWILNKEAVNYVLNFTNNNPKVVNFFKTVCCPEEHFFQIILLNSSLKNSVVDDNYTYIDWSNTQSSSPKILDTTDFEKIIQSNSLFCRKIDTQKSGNLANLLNNFIKK